MPRTCLVRSFPHFSVVVKINNRLMFPLANVVILIILAEEYSQISFENNKTSHIMCISCPIRAPNGLICR